MTKDVNNKVSSWRDVSGSPIDFTQTTLDSQPEWIPNALCGKPVLRFYGVDDFLTGGDVLDLGTNSRTAFIIAKKI